MAKCGLFPGYSVANEADKRPGSGSDGSCSLDLSTSGQVKNTLEEVKQKKKVHLGFR